MLLQGCAGTNAYWPADHLSKPRTSSQCVDAQYAQEGHYNTTDLVAKIAGLSATETARLAYFSQAPDAIWFLYSAPAVGVWGFVPPFWGYRSRIVNTLHSLHGGGPDDVDKRRTGLKNLITAHRSRKEPEWKVGFLIHAMGDSYAHVYGERESPHAYGGFVGHIFDNQKGSNQPDVIVENNNAEIYVDYVRALFEALSAGSAGGDREGLNDYAAAVKAQVEKSKDNAEFRRFVQGYRYCPKSRLLAADYKAQWWTGDTAEPKDNDQTAQWAREIHFFEVGEFLSRVREAL
jgi:hypothetical protein